MKRSKHSLSHFRTLSCDMGELVPIGCTEVLPGDTFQHATSLLVRAAPLNTPVMHPVHVRVHHWFVPLRIIWSSFENFITGGPTGTDVTTPPYIAIPVGGFAVGSLADYLGIPPSVGAGINVSALPFRAYNLIFNEWYRDQDLVTALVNSLGDGADTTSNTGLQYAAWEKDRFTSSRPWAQKGAAVSLPLGGQANVVLNPANVGNPGFLKKAADYVTNDTSVNPVKTDSIGALFGSGEDVYDPFGSLYADLTSATSATINQLRHALAVQRYEEARARYGSRYTEYLRYLGVRSSDARLQRPEYLGGGKQTLQFSEVLQTAPTTSGTPVTGVGSMQGHGIGAVRSNRYRRFFEEHGFVVTLLSVLPKTVYVNGLPKMFSYQTREDYWQKELEHIGQDTVANQEVYLADSVPTGVFGYQDRYDQYRRAESTVGGLFRTTLDTWHMGRIFAADVALNASFVQSNPASRIFQAHSANDELYVMAMHSIQARRMVSKIGTSSIF